MKSIVRAWAPGKLIITGEHAVVLGAPAIACALASGVEVSLKPEMKPGFSFYVERKSVAHFTLAELHQAAQRVQERFAAYTHGQISINKVLPQPELLAVAIVASVSSRLLERAPGFVINCHSDLPIGCGAGSSAAFIVALFTVLDRYLGDNITFDSCWQRSRQFEHLQHGHSSGLDVALSLIGGVCWFAESKIIPLEVKLPELWLIQTGCPASTTGEAVQQSQRCFTSNPALKAEFSAVTEGVKESLIAGDEDVFWGYLQRNQELLVNLGVVPVAVQRFTEELKKLGSVAKLSGAGAVRGDSAGILIAQPAPGLAELAAQAGYTLTKLEVTADGARCL